MSLSDLGMSLRKKLMGSLLLDPMSYLPAFDAALDQLAKVLHDPVKHKIADSQCKLD